MPGWTLFRDSVLLLADNLVAALRLSALPYGLVVALEIWIATTWPGLTFAPGVVVPQSFGLVSMAALLLSLVVSVWVAVAWHRYLLLQDAPAGWLPALNRAEIGGYIVRMMGLGLLVMAAVLIVGIVTAPFAVLFGVDSVMQASRQIALFVAMVLFYRFGMILPAISVGQNLDFGEAWRITEGKRVDVAILALLTLLLSKGLSSAVALDGGPGTFTPLYSAVTGWISLMLGVTLLTLLYSQVTEDRPFD